MQNTSHQNYKMGGGCIKVYPWGQIAELHLNFNTPGNYFFRKKLTKIVTLLQLHCNLH